MKVYFIFLILLAFNVVKATAAQFTCNFSSTPSIAFGTFVPTNNSELTIIGTVSVTCVVSSGNQNNLSYTISFSPGNSGNSLNRTMRKGSSNLLSYNLYKNNSYTQVLGANSGSSSKFTMTYDLRANDGPRTDTFNIYGKIPAQPSTVVGGYSDNILVTLTY